MYIALMQNNKNITQSHGKCSSLFGAENIVFRMIAFEQTIISVLRSKSVSINKPTLSGVDLRESK